MILSSLTGGWLFETWRGLPLLAGGFATCALLLLPAFFRDVRNRL